MWRRFLPLKRIIRKLMYKLLEHIILKDEALHIIRARNVLIVFSVSISSRDFFSSLKPGGGDDCTHHPHLKSRVDAYPHHPATYAPVHTP